MRSFGADQMLEGMVPIRRLFRSAWCSQYWMAQCAIAREEHKGVYARLRGLCRNHP